MCEVGVFVRDLGSILQSSREAVAGVSAVSWMYRFEWGLESVRVCELVPTPTLLGPELKQPPRAVREVSPP